MTHPGNCLLLLGLCTIPFAVGLFQLRLWTDGAAIYPKQDPVVERTESDRQAFREAPELIVLATPRAEVRLDSRAGLEYLKRVHASLAKIPGVEALRLRSFETLQDRLHASRISRGLLLAADGRAAALYVRLTGRYDRDRFVGALEEWARRNETSNFDLRLAGPVTPDLFESQFFGHCRGAFTGADRDLPGLLALANGGLLFLDEIESMTITHQAKLLRVLDDGEFRPVGSATPRRARVRVLAAINREPEEGISDGSLRRDIYYRLRGIEIRLTPLAERSEDIPVLAASFLGPARSQLTPDAARRLEEYPWPGNVRELRNVLHCALERAGKGAILPEHLALGRRSGTGREPDLNSGASLREGERRIILRALEFARGNRSHAARALGIDRSTLLRKLRRFDHERFDSEVS